MQIQNCFNRSGYDHCLMDEFFQDHFFKISKISILLTHCFYDSCFSWPLVPPLVRLFPVPDAQIADEPD